MSRTLLFKIGTIALLSVLLIVPFGMVDRLVGERRALRDRVIQDIAQSSTGVQRIEGVALIIPCTESFDERETIEDGRSVVRTRSRSCDLHLLPERLAIDGDIETDFRYRGIYRALVYRTQLALEGEFVVPATPTPANVQRKWGVARLVVGIAEIRGIRNAPSLKWNGERVAFESGTGKAPWPRGIQAEVQVDPVNGGSMTTSMALELAGMERLEILPAARDLKLNLRSKWPHPGFIGRHLPDHRKVNAEGFDASWRTTDLGTNVRQAFLRCTQGKCEDYAASAFGVAFVQTVDVYQQVYRAVHYGMLFVGLTFAAFFLYEVLGALRVHPMQYTLVGVALATFFLLLLAFSEHIRFQLAYLAAALACIGLITVYVRCVLGSWARAAALAGLLAGLYAAMYMVLGSEDYALLMGALLLFAALAVFMLLTRRLDWYAVSARPVDALHAPAMRTP